MFDLTCLGSQIVDDPFVDVVREGPIKYLVDELLVVYSVQGTCEIESDHNATLVGSFPIEALLDVVGEGVQCRDGTSTGLEYGDNFTNFPNVGNQRAFARDWLMIDVR